MTSRPVLTEPLIFSSLGAMRATVRAPALAPPRRARVHRRASLAAAADDALARCERAGTPLALRLDDLADDCSYLGDVHACSGALAYDALTTRWRERSFRDLRELTHAQASCARVGPNEYVTRWNAEFVPAKLGWLYDLALRWPFGELTIVKADILHKAGEVSRFTYRAVFALFARALRERTMTIPVARIEIVSALTFDENGKLKRHVENLTLVGEINAGRVRNKRVCRDVLEYLDCRKPPGVSLETWDEIVEREVDIYSVPGMRQLDVDGMEEEFADGGRVEDATAVLAFFTVVVLAFGFGFGAWYLQHVQHEAAFRRMLESGAY